MKYGTESVAYIGAPVGCRRLKSSVMLTEAHQSPYDFKEKQCAPSSDNGVDDVL